MLIGDAECAHAIIKLMKFYNKTVAETLAAVGSSPNGLSVTMARRRLRRDGPNVVKVAGVPLWKRVLQPFANVMVVVLIVAGCLSLWQGSYIDATIIFAIIMASAVIDWVQQYSTSRILRSLREREVEQVEVIRGGESLRISAESLVVGDIFDIYEGQKVPADARVINAANLHVDESMLTGESMSVRKSPGVLRGDKEVYDQSNMLFSGSFVVTGGGQAVVVATANNTEFGKLAQLAGDTSMESPIQDKIDRLIRWVIGGVFVLAIVVFALELLRGESLIDSLQFVLAFAVSAVPESLPIAITAVLAMGMRRMAAHKALVRNMRAIENIGLTTVIATDKTGTLTENKLHVQSTWSPRFNDESFALQTSFALNTNNKGKANDPLDLAILSFLHEFKIDDPARVTQAELVQALPFDYLMAMSGNVWRFGRRYAIYVKGAPEKVLARCKLTDMQQRKAEVQLTDYASRGYRVIAFAKCERSTPIHSLSDLTETNLEFLGFTAVADQLRPKIELAVSTAQAAGIRVCMITGDHSETAYNIAEAVGIADNRGQVYDSHKLAKLSPEKLAQVVGSTRVYARVTPDTKHAILTELNKTEITAMTGDGVNDVPALTQAHVGIAMGSGSAIAKDASDIVLLDDNFRSIVVAVKEGRTIVANIRRMLVYLLATNAGEVLVTLGALLLGMPLPLVAVQILWINLATDTFLVIPLGVEPPRGNVMQHDPDDPDAPILNRYMIGQMIVSAMTIAGLTLAVFAYFNSVYGLHYARSAVFLVLIVIQWVNALLMRGSESVGKILRVRNHAFNMAIVGTVVLQTIVLIVPAFRQALHVDYLHSDVILACIAAMVITCGIIELYKWWARRREQRSK